MAKRTVRIVADDGRKRVEIIVKTNVIRTDEYYISKASDDLSMQVTGDVIRDVLMRKFYICHIKIK